jgi:hypothetical protein
MRENFIVSAANRIFDPTPPVFKGTPVDRKSRFVDLSQRIPIFKNSTYLSASGKRLPGVTTVISKNLGWNKQALINWANQCGLSGKRHRAYPQLKLRLVCSVIP